MLRPFPFRNRLRGSASGLLVFAYGSNLFPARMKGRIASAEVLGRASLAGHRLRFHMRSTDGSGKADAHFTGAAADRVEGVIYRIAAEQLAILDRIESGYRRRDHEFRLPSAGEAVRAWTYHARRERIEPGLLPYGWYHRYVARGARAHRLPDEYVARIEQVPTIPDPRRDRVAAD